MANWRKFFPPHVEQLFLRLGIAWIMLYVTRIIFYISNFGAFGGVGFQDFLMANWFDIITVCLLFLPYYVLVLIPFNKRDHRVYRIALKLLFHSINSVLIALNLLDVEYFKYTSKRSTFDLFSLVSTGNDFNQLFTTFISDFWLLLILLIALITLSEWLYRKTEKITVKRPSIGLGRQSIVFFVYLPLFVILGRGGFGLKPVGIIEAARYCAPENTAFLLPTGFTMIKTIDQTGLTLVDYFKNEGDKKYFSPIKKSHPQHILPDGTNVVVILLESFGTEFVGAFNDGKGYTPFFDSIIAQSLSFEYSFANGKKSIEAVPAVFASIPSYMDNPYISSPYGDNTIDALPTILKKFGYESAFYHGATNGSMRFDGFAAICGFDHYYGRYEYNNDAHFDKTWGILDEYFNPWTAKKMSELKEPFFGTLFTLSSHHPYYIPHHMKKVVKHGPQKICASISYGDLALKKFFVEARKQPWYDNTLFVLLADHTPATSDKLYNQRTHLYRIPIVFYHPSGKLKSEKSDRLFQQLDILPTLLDLLNIETNYYAYGNSLYADADGEALTYLEGSYYYFKDNEMMVFSNGKVNGIYDFTSNSIEKRNAIADYSKNLSIFEKRIKSIIQRYNRDLILNQTKVK